MKSPKSLIDPPGPFSPKKVLEDFLVKAEQWAKEDPDDLSVTWAIREVKDSLKLQEAREGRKATLIE